MMAINAFHEKLATQIYLFFFTNVRQWACISNYVIPSDVQLTLDTL